MSAVASQIDKALAISGWMSEKELIWLATQASKALTIVEFGSFHGRSTRVMADNSSPETKIWAVDPWNGSLFDDDGYPLDGIDTFVLPIFKRNLEDHIDNGKVIPVRTFSNSFKLPHQVDMLFIDGDHRYINCRSDILSGLGLVKEGGIISGHDYNHPGWPGVKKAVDELLGHVQVEETIWWTRKS